MITDTRKKEIAEKEHEYRAWSDSVVKNSRVTSKNGRKLHTTTYDYGAGDLYTARDRLEMIEDPDLSDIGVVYDDDEEDLLGEI